MPTDDTPKNDPKFHLEGGIPVLNTELDEIKREQREAKKRDKEYKDEQVRLDRRMVWFTAALVLTSIVSGAISAWQATIANKSANAATSAAATAKDTLNEIQKGGTDTHELAVQARNEANQIKEIANRALMANEISRNTADAAKSAATTAEKQLELSERPWIGLDNEIVLDSPVDVSGKTPLETQSTEVFKNFGRSPALNVVQFPGLVTSERDLDREFPRTCAAAREAAGEGPIKNNLARDAIFPGKEVHRKYIRGLPPNPTFPIKGVYLFGCIAYTDEFAHWHQTRYCIGEPVFPPYQPVKSIPFACPKYNDAN